MTPLPFVLSDLQMIRNSDYVKIIGWLAKILLQLDLECFEELNKLSYNIFDELPNHPFGCHLMDCTCAKCLMRPATDVVLS